MNPNQKKIFTNITRKNIKEMQSLLTNLIGSVAVFGYLLFPGFTFTLKPLIIGVLTKH